MIGKRFNGLTVLGIDEERTRNKRTYYTCRCDCGNEKSVRSDGIKSGHTKSCGCLKSKHMKCVSEGNVIDLTGQVFGWLKVRSKSDRKSGGKTGNYFWNCDCKCGNKTVVRSMYLRNGQIVSCGCYHKMIVTGDKNGNYKEELTNTHRANTRNQLYGSSQASFRKRVLKRDNHKCRICMDDKKLVAHHLESYNSNVGERFNDDNGVTLCVSCHKGFHGMYGYGNNTKAQFIEHKRSVKDE